MNWRFSSGPLLVLFLLAVVLVGLPGSVAAQQEPPPPSDDDVNAIAKGLYCPVCENIPLDVCGTQACAQWRELIREKLSEGWTESQIKTYFVDQYGDRVLATPPARGLNWLVYVVPPVAFLAGVVILVGALRSWKRPAPSEVLPPDVEQGVAGDEYVDRLENELHKRD
jgi:cytochrome c-type biogenesis protein CcmH